MPCINTELKVYAVNKKVTPCEIDHLDDDALDIVCNELVKTKETIEYLEWQMAKIPSTKVNVTDPETDQVTTLATQHTRKTLYIASDSPTSQYRNKKICFLMKKFATDNAFDICWIYTEKVHGKGPMDGVGSAVKHVIIDTIVYHPK